MILLRVPGAVATADAVRHAITTAFASLPAGLRRTLTWDQGKELALHQQITASTGTGVFFCDAHAPWQRGSNENINGLLRDYFPKGTDLSVHTAEDIQRVAARSTTGLARRSAGADPQTSSPTPASPPESNAPEPRTRASTLGPSHDSAQNAYAPRTLENSTLWIAEPASPLRGSGHPPESDSIQQRPDGPGGAAGDYDRDHLLRR